MQADAKACLEVPAQHHRALSFHDGAAGQSTSDGIEDLLRVHTGLLGEHQGFAQGLDVGRHNYLVGQLGDAAGADFADVDGVRVNTADGWWLLRASNTQAVLVARCESTNDAGLQRLKADVATQLEASGVTPPDF